MGHGLPLVSTGLVDLASRVALTCLNVGPKHSHGGSVVQHMPFVLGVVGKGSPWGRGGASQFTSKVLSILCHIFPGHNNAPIKILPHLPPC